MRALDRIRSLVAAVPWRATAYLAPHEYVMADWTRETEELVRLVMQEVRGQDGYSRMFRERRSRPGTWTTTTTG